MKTILLMISVAAICFLTGCGGSSSQGASGFDGTYIEVDNTDISLVVKGDRWRQGASDIYADCTFVSRSTGENSYEVDLTFLNEFMELKGHKTTVILRKEGDFVIVIDKDSSEETKFKRK